MTSCLHATIPAMSEPHDHHYVPQMLLREFAHGSARQWLWVYDKRIDRIFRGTVKKSAQRLDYYTLDRRAGSPDVELERVFGLLETDAAPALARLRAAQFGLNELHPLDRFKIAVFMAVQHARVPAVRDLAESGARLWAAAKIDKALADKPELLQTWRTGEFEAVPPAGLVQLELLHQAMNGLAERFFDMRWSIVRRRRFPRLVLGDAPVSPLRPAGISDDEWKGFSHPDVDIVLPISPEHLLLLNGTRTDDTIEVIDDETLLPRLARWWVYEANEATWIRAARHIYGRSHADLEAARFALYPPQRQSVRRPKVKNLAPELAVHARDFEVVDS